jgi:hypothetical protein
MRDLSLLLPRPLHRPPYQLFSGGLEAMFFGVSELDHVGVILVGGDRIVLDEACSLTEHDLL